MPQAFATDGETEIIIQKSRFIASGGPVSTPDEAADFLVTVQQRYPQANHHCYAYKVTGPPATDRFSDDGEPNGTAGKPILTILEHHLQNSIIVVTRYFGGTKLGKGGLVRAYTQASKSLLEAIPLREDEPLHTVRLRYPYTLSAQIEYHLHKKSLAFAPVYAADIEVELQLTASDYGALKTVLEPFTLQGLRFHEQE